MNLKKYLIATTHSVSRGIYSAGQSYFAVHNLSTYIFRNTNHSATYIIPSIAIFTGQIVNCITRFPANFRLYTGLDKGAAPKIDLAPLNKFGNFLYYLFQVSGHLSNFFNSLNAYFGAVVTIETLIELFNGSHAELWKTGLIDLAALAIAISALSAFYAYEFQTIKSNARRIASNLSDWRFTWDSNMTKTILLSTLNIIASPLLAKYWTGPSLGKIPFSEKILASIGKELVSWTAGIVAFSTGLAMLPSVYDFLTTGLTTPPSQNKLLGNLIKIGAFGGGPIDSAFAGACLSYAMISVSKDFNIDPYSYWQTITVPFGISTFVLNMTFSVMPGYQELMKTLSKPKEDQIPLLQDQEIKLNDSKANPVIIDMPVNQSSFYRKKSSCLLFTKCCHKKDPIELEENLSLVLAH